MSKTGPILVFLRIHPFARVFLLYRGIVCSRHKCCICCPSSVSSVQKYCSRSTSFKLASEHNLDNFWSSDHCSNFRSYSCRRFLHCCSLVEFSASERTGRNFHLFQVLRCCRFHRSLCTLCERVVYRHGPILLILRVRSGFSTRRFRPHGG